MGKANAVLIDAAHTQSSLSAFTYGQTKQAKGGEKKGWFFAAKLGNSLPRKINRSINYKGGIAMKSNVKRYVMALGLACMLLAPGTAVMAATNQATDPGGGGVTLTGSGIVTVTANALQLVKQVYSAAGACLASSPADVNCNSSAISVTVPSGTLLKFVIFARNTSDLALADLRIQDLLDDTAGVAGGFTYSPGTIKVNNTQSDVATLANIYTAVNAGTVQTDAVGGPDDFASMNTAVSPDRLTIGAVTGQANNAVSAAAHSTYAILFQATKN